MTIYEKIRMLRESLGITQTELARRTGFRSRSSIAKIELGMIDVSIDKVGLFAEALHTTPAYLMGWDEATEEDLDRQIQELFDSLPPEKQQQALQFLRFLESQGK